jgi:hypothetical protein
MKKTVLVGLAIGLASLAATAAFAGKSADGGDVSQGYTGQKNTGAAGIVNSSHDLSGTTGAGRTAATIASGTDGVVADVQSRICVYCHHPHNAYSATGATGGGRTGAVAAIGAYSPLWNRQMSTKNFVPYNNGSMMGNLAGNSNKQHALNAAQVTNGTAELSGVSLLCMSCHDGVVGMNAYSVVTGSTLGAGNNTVVRAITSSAGFAGDMNNHHPMGFNYDAVQALDNEIAASSTLMVRNSTVTISSLLDGGRMECVTCHDVHNTANRAGAERFLWTSNNRSNFCLTCHLK